MGIIRLYINSQGSFYYVDLNWGAAKHLFLSFSGSGSFSFIIIFSLQVLVYHCFLRVVVIYVSGIFCLFIIFIYLFHSPYFFCFPECNFYVFFLSIFSSQFFSFNSLFFVYLFLKRHFSILFFLRRKKM